jgi:uncharacterized damage-inducible protein DinB
MRSIQELRAHYRRQRVWTRTLAAAIPAEHAEWAPSAADFSCIGLVRHLMASEVFWRRLLVAATRGEVYDPFQLPGTPVERLAAFREPNVRSSRGDKHGRTVEECLERWLPIQRETEEALGAITPEQLDSVEVYHPLAGLRAPLWELFLVMIAHEGHHRGQLSAYLKILGVRQPPIFTAEAGSETAGPAA